MYGGVISGTPVEGGTRTFTFTVIAALTQGIVRDLEAKLAERDARIEYLERELERERESGKGVREDGYTD